MKNITIRTYVCVSLFALILVFGGCASDESKPDRVAALEAEVKALKQESAARDKAVREELALIRQSLEGIQSLMADAKDPAASPESLQETPEDTKDALDDAIDIKAKTFVKESLDKLLAITKKLLESMERDIDRQMKKDDPHPEAPKGDQI